VAAGDRELQVVDVQGVDASPRRAEEAHVVGAHLVGSQAPLEVGREVVVAATHRDVVEVGQAALAVVGLVPEAEMPELLGHVRGAGQLAPASIAGTGGEAGTGEQAK
jgi:hypothetical protein